MAKIVNIFSSMDEEMRGFEKKIWVHRRKRLIIYAAIILTGILIVLGVSYYLGNRSFTSYSIASVTERNDTVTTKYTPFGGKILKYSRDGVSYTDEKNSLLFSITYTMQNPILALSDRAGAVADKNGHQIYTFNREKQTGQITTLLPIKQITISNQGIAAVFMEDGNAVKMEIYSAEGTLLGDGVFSLEDAGYPMNASISVDGTKIVIAFAQINDSKLKSCVAVYNFDNVGENYVDHLVFTKNYEENLIPEVHYFDESTFAAVGDGVLSIYEGTQIPVLIKEITFEEKVKSVFYGERNIGLVFEGAEGDLLKLYNFNGDIISEIPFSMDYDNIRIAEQWILIYNENEMGMYSYSGKECFRNTFETSVLDIFLTDSRSKYLFIYTNETQMIKLQ